MKCALCSKAIDHEKKIEPEQVKEQKEHAKALSQWRQITISLWVGRGEKYIFQGHLCPTHQEDIDKGRIVVALKGA